MVAYVCNPATHEAEARLPGVCSQSSLDGEDQATQLYTERQGEQKKGWKGKGGVREGQEERGKGGRRAKHLLTLAHPLAESMLLTCSVSWKFVG